MRRINLSFLLTTVLLLSGPAKALEFIPSPAVATVFSQAKATGTFVLLDISQQKLYGYEQKRAETRFIPASTFKIPNSLIGLSSGAVSSVDEIFLWDGKPRAMRVWDKDMGLREAIKVSNVPVYQELARRIGLPLMQEQLDKLGYGNHEAGTVVDRFWLDGPLKISAIEQTRFLARLAQGQLPFPEAIQAKVREISRQEQGENWTLYAKTGVAGTYQPQLGWWVGWLEQNGKLYSFALNMDMPEPEKDIPRRIEIGKASLKALGLM